MTAIQFEEASPLKVLERTGFDGYIVSGNFGRTTWPPNRDPNCDELSLPWEPIAATFY